MAIKKDVTVYIGRFNPFHLGHAYVLEQALQTSKLVIVLVGSAFMARTPKNPFSFEERKAMIMNWAGNRQFANDGAILQVLPLRDHASNNVWIKSVQKSVKDTMTSVAIDQNMMLTNVHITGSQRDESTWYLKAFPQWKLDLVPAMSHKPGTSDDLSATSIRDVLYKSDLSTMNIDGLKSKLPNSTIRFIQYFIREQRKELDRLRTEYAFIEASKAKWAVAPYQPTFQTADAVIIQSGHVLMVRRGNQPGYGLWALPGGYVNQNERIRDAAVREAMEETGIRLTTGKNAKEITERMLDGAIRAKETFDDPNRSERGRIITVAYLMRLDDTKPLPTVAGQNVPFYESDGKDEVETLEAKFIPIDWVLTHTTQVFEDHAQIIEVMAAKMDE